MDAIRYTAVRTNLAKTMAQVCEDHSILAQRPRHERPVASVPDGWENRSDPDILHPIDNRQNDRGWQQLKLGRYAGR